MYSEKNETIQMAKTYLSAYYHNLFDTEYISIPEKGHLCNPIIEKPAGKRGIRPMMALQKAIRLESNFIFEY